MKINYEFDARVRGELGSRRVIYLINAGKGPQEMFFLDLVRRKPFVTETLSF